MWVKRREYDLMRRIAEENERDANIIRSIAVYLNEGKLLMNDHMVVMTPEYYDSLVHEKNSLADQVAVLTTERDMYRQRWQSLLHIRKEDKREVL